MTQKARPADQYTKFQQIVDDINKEVPAQTMWDGFWIHSFKRGTLVISASYDIIYGSTFDFIFKKVIFFNVPYRWRDTNVVGNDSLRLSNPLEFRQHHPDFDTQGLAVFAIDMNIEMWRAETTQINGVEQRQYIQGSYEQHTFFIVAAHIYLKPYDPDFRYLLQEEYDDPYQTDNIYPSLKNRVAKKKT